MRRFFSQHRLPCTTLAILGAVASPGAVAVDVQVGRYATVAATPTEAQARLLSAIVQVAFPASVANIGEAIAYLLRSSGYRLASQAAAGPARATLLNLPLPQPHRVLGPMPLQTALETLAGPAFRLVEDPVHRLVSFERCAPATYAPSTRPDDEAR